MRRAIPWRFDPQRIAAGIRRARVSGSALSQPFLRLYYGRESGKMVERRGYMKARRRFTPILSFNDGVSLEDFTILPARPASRTNARLFRC